MRKILLVCIIIVSAFAITTAQTEPEPDTHHPVFSTQGAEVWPTLDATIFTRVPPAGQTLPPVLNGTLPPTVTPWPTPRVTPTLWLPTSMPNHLDSVDFAWRWAGKVLQIVLSFVGIGQAF